MSYSVKYSARQGSWYVQVDGLTDDCAGVACASTNCVGCGYGTSLYDTEQEAYDELAQMVTEGLIDQSEITYPISAGTLITQDEIYRTPTAASVRGEVTFPHATRNGEVTLCGMRVEEIGAEFDKVLLASRCPWCHERAA